MEKNAAAFSMGDAVNRDYHTARFPELAPFEQPSAYKSSFAHRMKQRTEDMLQGVFEEIPIALHQLWGDESIWQRRGLGEDIPYLMARCAARLFVGEELCKNDAWLQITQEVTRGLVLASIHLQMVPYYLRPVAWRFLPSCRRIRLHIRKALSLVEPVVEQRRLLAEKKGYKAEHEDVVDWFQQIGADGDNLARAFPQLQLCVASTAVGDLMLQVFNNLCTHPDTMIMLRKEVMRVLQKHNGSITIAALKELKHMDSFLKETLRLKPTAPIIMGRKAVRDVTFDDGTYIPKGTYVSVSQLNLLDDKIYTSARTFEPTRFLDKAQFATSSIDNLVWGHGQSACAGRFFTSYAVKMTLVHVLLKYEFELAPDSVQPDPLGLPAADLLRAEDRATMKIRRRRSSDKLFA
ncbi:MAG: hypothetical protein Q9162_006198 [Coniocarpon cinnabarinum]